MKAWARSHRPLLTLTMACVIAVVMAIWGLIALTRPFPHLGSDSCSTSGTTIKRSAVTISIYNAGAAAGSAARLATSLRDFGFKVAKVGNAPDGLTVDAVQIVGISTADPAAQLVAAAFGSPVVDNPDQLIGPGVNVFIGPQLAPLVASAPAQITVGDAACSN